MKTALALLILVIADCAGSLFLASGMKQVGAVNSLRFSVLLGLVKRAILNLKVWLGILGMTIAFFMFVSLLSWADLSFVIPATALTEPVNMLASRYILGEKVTSARWVSLGFIVSGIILISVN